MKVILKWIFFACVMEIWDFKPYFVWYTKYTVACYKCKPVLDITAKDDGNKAKVKRQ